MSHETRIMLEQSNFTEACDKSLQSDLLPSNNQRGYWRMLTSTLPVPTPQMTLPVSEINEP